MARPPRLRARLLESQNHRCCFCGGGFHKIYGECKVKIYPDQERSYDNCVLLCHKCQGPATAYPDLVQYYEAFISPPVKKEKTYTITADNVDRLVAMLAPRCQDAGVSMPEMTKLLPFEKAPPSRIEVIAESLFRLAVLNHPTSTKRGMARGFKEFPKKVRWGEGQGHRCCYCSVEFDYQDQFSPIYPTWEHVVNRRDQGTWDPDNLVVACKMCNNDRDAMNVSALAFWQWLQVPEHRLAHDKRRVDLLREHHRPLRQHLLSIRQRKNQKKRRLVTR